MIARIAVSGLPFSADKPYSYAVPDGLRLEPGIRVMVPFGRANRQTEGVVLELVQGSQEGLKSVDRSLDQEPVISRQMLYLAAFLRDRCFCSYYDCLRSMLPAGLWFHTKNSYRLTDDRSWQEKPGRQKDAMEILKLLLELGGEAEESRLRELVPEEPALLAALQYLRRKKWITGRTDFLHNSGDKTEQIATLVAPAEEAMEFAQSRPRSAAMQKAVLELLCGVGSASVKDICYYTGAALGTIKSLERKGYLRLTRRQVLRCRQIEPVQPAGPLVLNEEQQCAYLGLASQMEAEKPGAALLYGVTGSGKTSVYLKLIQRCLELGRSALLLVPEIALTPQLLSLLAGHFGDRVALQHSSLSTGERYDQWRRIRSGQAQVIVGTRSAVFAPGQRLGLLIVDEEQEHSYKSENTPRYDAREVALWRGAREGALVLFGSATPSVETMYRAQTGLYKLYALTRRYNGRPLPQVQIVDLRRELMDGNDLSLSRELVRSIQQTHQAGKQTILFLNRRGNSRALVCVECGQAPECPRCNARLVYHSANGRLMCHYCGFSQGTPARCPSCGGPMKRIGTGTQKVQQELLSLMPDLEIDRMDADTVSAVNTHEKILQHFSQCRVPVLVGTQMVAKGLNLENVTLVGVLDADLGLYSAGYRAAESTFNMLTQVVGRAGRGDAPGRAVIQTMVPEHPVIQLAARQDYDAFYRMELEIRRVQQYPPFGDLAAVTFVGQEEQRLLHGAVKFRQSLLECLRQGDYSGERCQVLGPAPCTVPKINYNFRYRLTLRCAMSKKLRLLLAHLLRQFMQDRENRGVSAFVDVNSPED